MPPLSAMLPYPPSSPRPIPQDPTVPTRQGRLELTWANKHLRLLAHDDGAYEWVPPADERVAEVRLLHDAGTVGQVASAAT